MYKLLTYILIFLTFSSHAQWQPNSTADTDVRSDVSEAIELFQANSQLNVYFDQAHAYAIFPSIKKAGIGIGGSRGKGQVFEN